MKLSKGFVVNRPDAITQIGAFIRQHWQERLEAGSPLTVYITEYEARRSTQQNAYYWHLVSAIAEQAVVNGRLYGKDVWHEQLKQMFLGREALPFGGEVPVSSSSLTVKEFEEYINEVQAWATQEMQVDFDQEERGQS